MARGRLWRIIQTRSSTPYLTRRWWWDLWNFDAGLPMNKYDYDCEEVKRGAERIALCRMAEFRNCEVQHISRKNMKKEEETDGKRFNLNTTRDSATCAAQFTSSLSNFSSNISSNYLWFVRVKSPNRAEPWRRRRTFNHKAATATTPLTIITCKEH